MTKAAEKFAMSPEAVARAVAYLVDQPDDVNVGEVIIRSTAQP
jgi:NADP-dependent 3-hydroxy acid dehydrogenase YdfG